MIGVILLFQYPITESQKKVNSFFRENGVENFYSVFKKESEVKEVGIIMHRYFIILIP